jgi:hypothetical protein
VIPDENPEGFRMADAPRESNTPIIVALIGVTGVIATALFGNWDKIFPPQPAPSAPAPEVAAAAEAAIQIAGNWHDDDGYTYLFQQNGDQFQYRMALNGAEQSSGSGTVDGRTLTYRYAGGDGNYGSCSGVLSDDGSAIAGQCQDTATGQSWPFQIKR